MSFSVLAPASSANLGPGFDCFAIALDLWTRVDVELSGGRDVVVSTAPDLLGGDNLVITAMKHAAARLGIDLPGCRISVTSSIPIARGLGSSAAATVAGVRIVGELAREALPCASLIAVASAVEGHADNVAAATLGGITVAVQTQSGYIAEVMASSAPWTVVVFIPDETGYTRDARDVLPDRIPMTDAVANVSRSALLAFALREKREDLLREAMQDRLHQPYRRTIYPHLNDAIEAAYIAGALGACLSGAGPTILALTRRSEATQVGEALEAASRDRGMPGRQLTLPIASCGCQVVGRA